MPIYGTLLAVSFTVFSLNKRLVKPAFIMTAIYMLAMVVFGSAASMSDGLVVILAGVPLALTVGLYLSIPFVLAPAVIVYIIRTVRAKFRISTKEKQI
jgi:hypothetical protein